MGSEILLGLVLACGVAEPTSESLVMSFTDTDARSNTMQVYLLDRPAFLKLSGRRLVSPSTAITVAAEHLGLQKSTLSLRISGKKRDLKSGKVVEFHRLAVAGGGYKQDVLVLPGNVVLEPRTVADDYMAKQNNGEGCANQELESAAKNEELGHPRFARRHFAHPEVGF